MIMITAVDASRSVSRASTSTILSVSAHPLLRKYSTTAGRAENSKHARLGSLVEADANADADSLTVTSCTASQSDHSANTNSTSSHENEPTVALRLPAINTGRTQLVKEKVEMLEPKASTKDPLLTNRIAERTVQELMNVLREKIKSSFVEMRKRFADNDPEMKGTVTREALLRLVTTAAGHSVSVNLLNKLLDHVGIGNKHTISFSEFATKMCQSADDFKWLSSRCSSRDGENQRPSTKDTVRSIAQPFAPVGRGSNHDSNRLVIEKEIPNIKLVMIKEDDDETGVVPEATHPVKASQPASAYAETLDDETESQKPSRSAEEVDIQIKSIFANRYGDVERAFRELDQFNSNCLTVDSMISLFEQLNVDPPITRAEIEAHLWPRFYLRDKARLDFWEFCRHFMYTKETAAFPNSKRHPPRKGDADFLLRSLEVNSDSDLVRGSVRMKIDLYLDKLRLGFLEKDPLRSGAIGKAEFRKVLQDLEPDINEYELQVLAQRYRLPNSPEGRVNYIEFLAPFTARRLPSDHTSQQDKMDFVFTHSTPRPEDGSLNGASVFKSTRKFIAFHKGKLLQKSGALKRAFMSLDPRSTGFLSIAELRTTLKLIAEIEVGNEDWFEVLSELDTQLTGKLNYKKFLSLIEELRVKKNAVKKETKSSKSKK